MLFANGVDRRTGGLEMGITQKPWVFRVDRRTGGLEKIMIRTWCAWNVDRRTGGLEKELDGQNLKKIR